MTQRPPTDAPTARGQNALAFVKLMRSSGFAVIDTVAERHVETVGAGQHPHGFAVHPTGRWAYFAYASSGTVEVIDTRTLDVVDTTDAVGTAPIGIECSRDGRRLYVTAYGALPDTEEPGLSILQTNARTTGELEPLAHRPIGKCAGIVVDAADDLWIAMKDDDEVVRMRGGPSFECADRLSVPGDPQDVAYAPEYRLLGVNNVEDGSVSFVDIGDRQLLATVDAPNPRGGVVSRATDRWFVSDMEGDGLTVVDLSAGTPTRADRVSLGTPTAFADVAPGGEYAVVDAYDDDRVTFLDTRRLEPVARVRTGETPRHPRFSADGHRCYVPNVDGDSFTILDTSVLFEQDTPEPTVRTHIELPENSSPSSCFLTERTGRGSYR